MDERKKLMVALSKPVFKEGVYMGCSHKPRGVVAHGYLVGVAIILVISFLMFMVLAEIIGEFSGFEQWIRDMFNQG